MSLSNDEGSDSSPSNEVAYYRSFTKEQAMFAECKIQLDDTELVEALQTNHSDMSEFISSEFLNYSLYLCVVTNKLCSFDYILKQFESRTDIDPFAHVVDDTNVFKLHSLMSSVNSVIFVTLERSQMFPLHATYPAIDQMCHKTLLHCLLDTILYDYKFDRFRRCFCTKGDTQSPHAWIRTNVTLDELKFGIEVYKRIISQNPSLQFVTTFARHLPHMYAKHRLEQLHTVHLTTHEQDSEQHQDPVLLPGCQKALESIFDAFATTSSDPDGKGDQSLVMSTSDFGRYILSCTASTGSTDEARILRLFESNHAIDEGNDETTLTKQGFLRFYRSAALVRPFHLVKDVVIHGYGGSLLGDLYTDKDDANFERSKIINEVRFEFGEFLESNFVKCEKMLISGMIRRASMEKTFAMMIDDMINVLFKFLHPLNLGDQDYETSLVDEQIRDLFKYTFDCSLGYKKSHLWYHSFYRKILMKPLLAKYSLSKAEEVIEGKRDTALTLQQIRQCAMGALDLESEAKEIDDKHYLIHVRRRESPGIVHTLLYYGPRIHQELMR